jgi:GNAT superfamily N-acetyltransferase
MQVQVAPLQDEAQSQELESFLAERIYEFNSNATGYFDGKLLAGAVRNEQGEVIAGFSGHTWGGCCELSHVWVHEQHRGQGLGVALLASAEAETRSRGCVQVVLSTHSFQAPGFYESLGYERKYALEGRPQGHSQLIYSKRLQGKNAA